MAAISTPRSSPTPMMGEYRAPTPGEAPTPGSRLDATPSPGRLKTEKLALDMLPVDIPASKGSLHPIDHTSPRPTYNRFADTVTRLIAEARVHATHDIDIARP